MGTEVYSWRVSSELKSELERKARAHKISVSKALDVAARDWLKKSASDESGEDEQRRLHAAASACFGTIVGNDPHRSENVRDAIKARLRRRNAR